MAPELKPYDTVRIVSDRFAKEGAPPGTLGVVIEKWPDGAVEVEVSRRDGTTIAQFSARQDELEPAPPEKPQDITLPLNGREVRRCYVDHAFGIMFFEGPELFDLRIGGPFKLTHMGTELLYSVEDADISKMGGALRLLHKKVRTGVARKDGALEIAFNDGTVLSVGPDQHYESWELSGPKGLLIVSTPGGGLAYWSARNESSSRR